MFLLWDRSIFNTSLTKKNNYFVKKRRENNLQNSKKHYSSSTNVRTTMVHFSFFFLFNIIKLLSEKINKNYYQNIFFKIIGFLIIVYDFLLDFCSKQNHNISLFLLKKSVQNS